MTKINATWLKGEVRWAEWNGEEFQCVDESTAREMLAEIERLTPLLRQLAEAVIEEHDKSVGQEGPSWTLAEMAKDALKATQSESGTTEPTSP